MADEMANQTQNEELNLSEQTQIRLNKLNKLIEEGKNREIRPHASLERDPRAV